MNTNEIPPILVGGLVRHPKLRWIGEGKPVATISVAVTPRHNDQATQQWTDGTPTYADCTVSGEPAEHVANPHP